MTPAGALGSGSADRGRLIAAAYETPDGRRAAHAAALAVYRCRRRGCLLLHVWQSPAGVLFYLPPYRLSPGRNAAGSSPGRRAVNTRDGDRRWMGHGGSLDDLRDWPQAALPLQCDHQRRNEPVADVLDVVTAATPGRPVPVIIN